MMDPFPVLEQKKCREKERSNVCFLKQILKKFRQILDVASVVVE